MNDGWITPTGYSTGKSYTYGGKFKWWQFIKRRRWNKAIANITPGTRIRFKQPGTFAYDFTIHTVISINEDGKTFIAEPPRITKEKI